MGNFSISHYSRIETAPGRSRILYVLDFAELPTFELLQSWGLAVSGATAAGIRERAEAEAPKWIANLAVKQNGLAVAPRMSRVSVKVDDGAGGMPVLMVTMEADIALRPGTVDYEDRNFAERPGWKEIVITASAGAAVTAASPPGADRSKALSSYPAVPAAAAPRDVRASFAWKQTSLPASAGVRDSGGAVAAASPDAGGLSRGDFLSRLLSRRDLGWGMMLAALAAAFGLGAMHALSPGHGKTIVAAYLVGSRGTPRHALFLGAMVTFTHTASVFLLGLAVLFFERRVQPEKIIPVLGALSGVSILALGGWLLYRRIESLAMTGATTQCHHHRHGHHHHHHHGLGPGFVHTHSHGGIKHSHVIPEGGVSLPGLAALGVSGGLAPCPSALILMLSAIGIGRTAFGMGLLVAFSAGLALVLTAVGLAVIFAKDHLPASSSWRDGPAARLVPVLSALVVMALGGIMTLGALGWIRPLSLFA